MPQEALKVIVIGDSATGKTTLVNSIGCVARGQTLSSEKCLQTEPTIGTNFLSITYDPATGSHASQHYGHGSQNSMRLNVWDTAGSEMFRSIVPRYYRNTDVCILVFDVSSRESFNNLESWLTEFKSNCASSSRKPPRIIVACTKCDLNVSRHAVSVAEMEKWYNDNLANYEGNTWFKTGAAGYAWGAAGGAARVLSLSAYKEDTIRGLLDRITKRAHPHGNAASDDVFDVSDLDADANTNNDDYVNLMSPNDAKHSRAKSCCPV
jgi:small GTP-binding protein